MQQEPLVGMFEEKTYVLDFWVSKGSFKLQGLEWRQVLCSPEDVEILRVNIFLGSSHEVRSSAPGPPSLGKCFRHVLNDFFRCGPRLDLKNSLKEQLSLEKLEIILHNSNCKSLEECLTEGYHCLGAFRNLEKGALDTLTQVIRYGHLKKQTHHCNHLGRNPNDDDIPGIELRCGWSLRRRIVLYTCCGSGPWAWKLGEWRRSARKLR